jgi:hypothetical protein
LGATAKSFAGKGAPFLKASARTSATAAPALSGRLLGLFKLFRMLPVFSVLVVFFSLFRIAQHLICLIDLLEFFIRFLVVGVQVGMMLPRQLPVCGPDFVLGCGFAHPQYFIIIYEIHGMAFFAKVGNLLAQFFYPAF